MNISPIVYEKLSNHERIIASLEALGRNDQEEKKRLVETCPKKNYRMNDHGYCSFMEALQNMVVSVECDMRGHALNFMMLLWLESKVIQEKWDRVYKFVEQEPEQLIKMISVQRAWHEFLEESNIPLSTMQKAHSDLPHFTIKWLIMIAEDCDLNPDPQITQEYKNVLKEHFEAI
ncbi:MAG: hypothetical protein L6Q57_08865 [Alphaproteobacteria bacterium]|nr:hypothetical protein [Alphaproteobacteria bacterium]